MSQVIHTHISHTQTHDQQKVCLCSRARAALPHDISRETRHDAIPPHTTHLIHATHNPSTSPYQQRIVIMLLRSHRQSQRQACATNTTSCPQEPQVQHVAHRGAVRAQHVKARHPLLASRLSRLDLRTTQRILIQAQRCSRSPALSAPQHLSPQPQPSAYNTPAALYFAMRSSITGRKLRMSPCTGQAAASPSAQMVWPSICREISSSMSISPGEALPTVKRWRMLYIHMQPSRHGVHCPQLSCLKKEEMRATTAIGSCDLSITVMEPVPSADLYTRSPSKSMMASLHISAVSIGTETPPGMTACRLSQPPLTPPPCFSIKYCIGTPISSSTVQGLLTLPPTLKSLVPLLPSRPKLLNHAGPRRRIVGTTATVSTFVTVVGQLHSPTLAGKGGFSRGLPCLPS